MKNFLSLNIIPQGWLTVISGWLIALAALLCASPTVAAMIPWIDCKVVAGIAGGTGLIGLRRAIANASIKK